MAQHITIDTVLKVGAVTAPLNSALGDLTATRLMVGTDTAFDSLSNVGGLILDNMALFVQAAHAPPSNNTAAVYMDVTLQPDGSASGSGRHDVFNMSLHVQPSAASSHRHSALTFLVTHDAGAFDLSSASGLVATTAQVVQNVALSIVTIADAYRSQVSATAGTISTARHFVVNFGTAADAGTITVENGLHIVSNVIPSGGVTQRAGVYIRNVGGAGLVNNYGIFVAAQSGSTVDYGAHFGDNRVAIGGDAPGASVSGTKVEGADGLTALSRLMMGLELGADDMNTSSKYTAALKFMSTDASLTTENPKLLGAIVGEALETYSADTSGGMALVFFATPNAPGATVLPTEAFRIHSDGIRAAGYARIGSAVAPTNVTAGDLTAVRLSLGNGAAFGGGAGDFVDIRGTVTDTAAASRPFMLVSPTIAPTSNSSSDFRTLYYSAFLSPPTGVTLNIVTAGYFEIRNRSDAAIAALNGLSTRPLVVDSSSPATVGAVALTVGLDVYHHVRPSGTSTVAVTSAVGVRFGSTRIAAGYTGTTLRDIYIQGMTFSSLATWIGIDIETPTVAPSVASFGIRNTSNMVQTGYARFGAITAPTNVTNGDLTALRAMFGTDTSLTSGPIVFIKQPTMGSEVFRMESVGSGTIGNARISRYQGGVETTDATVTTLISLTIPTDTSVQIDAWALGRRTGGAAGTAGDTGGYEDRGVFKNIGGVVTQVGTTDHSLDREDQAPWDTDFAISGTSVLFRVNGAANNNVRWHGNLEVSGWIS